MTNLWWVGQVSLPEVETSGRSPMKKLDLGVFVNEKGENICGVNKMKREKIATSDKPKEGAIEVVGGRRP